MPYGGQWSIARSMQAKKSKLMSRLDTAAKQIAILKAATLTTNHEKALAMQWLLENGWTAEQVKEKIK